MTNILIVGVGGQGTLLASRVLGAIADIEGLDCKLSEVHGMSQRGGSVVTHVRMGDNICAPLVSEGDADFIMAFEKLEAMRWGYYLKKEGKILINDQEIMPMPVITGAAQYPENVLDELRACGIALDALDALSLANEAGSAKAVNIVLMGRLAKYLDIPLERWLEEIEKSVKPQFVEINKKAFTLGYNYSC